VVAEAAGLPGLPGDGIIRAESSNRFLTIRSSCRRGIRPQPHRFVSTGYRRDRFHVTETLSGEPLFQARKISMLRTGPMPMRCDGNN
jgi:hypothetical protein